MLGDGLVVELHSADGTRVTLCASEWDDPCAVCVEALCGHKGAWACS